VEALFRYWGNDEHKMKMDDNKTMTKTIKWKIKETMNTHTITEQLKSTRKRGGGRTHNTKPSSFCHFNEKVQ